MTVIELSSTRLHPFLQEDEFSMEGPRTPFLGPHKHHQELILEKIQASPLFPRTSENTWLYGSLPLSTMSSFSPLLIAYVIISSNKHVLYPTFVS